MKHYLLASLFSCAILSACSDKADDPAPAVVTPPAVPAMKEHTVQLRYKVVLLNGTPALPAEATRIRVFYTSYSPATGGGFDVLSYRRQADVSDAGTAEKTLTLPVLATYAAAPSGTTIHVSITPGNASAGLPERAYRVETETVVDGQGGRLTFFVYNPGAQGSSQDFAITH